MICMILLKDNILWLNWNCLCNSYGGIILSTRSTRAGTQSAPAALKSTSSPTDREQSAATEAGEAEVDDDAEEVDIATNSLQKT